MASKEEKDTLRLLVQHVARGFYEPKYTIVLDQLARHDVLKDDELAGRMGLQAKELNKLMAVLSNDRLVEIYRQNELKEGAQRSVGRQYYYIDYQLFCNVVKWRVAEMRRKIDSTLRNELDNKGFMCPQCHKSYPALEVDKLIDYARGVFLCEICRHELVDNEDPESVRGSQDRMQRFNRAMRFVTEGLKKSESMVVPHLDVALWVKNNTTESEKQKQAQAGGLKVAGSDPNGRMEDDGVGVVMSLDKDEATRKMEREQEAAAKRSQNALPAWHLKSTISGDLTALGVAENARPDKPAQGEAALDTTTSNDAILRGLGTVTRAETVSTVIEDVKPAVNQDLDYYDQYYASLAASVAASTENTPSGVGAADDFGDFATEEEERKPSVDYLDIRNEFQKRSRSVEDIGTAAPKVAKTEHEDSPLLNGNGHAMAAEASPEPSASEEAGDDPVVYVNGAPKAFSKVTEEDQELMTPEEYTSYFEVFQARSS